MTIVHMTPGVCMPRQPTDQSTASTRTTVITLRSTFSCAARSWRELAIAASCPAAGLVLEPGSSGLAGMVGNTLGGDVGILAGTVGTMGGVAGAPHAAIKMLSNSAPLQTLTFIMGFLLDQLRRLRIGA